MEEFILKIEDLRLELNKLTTYKLLTDPEVIKASQLLDEMLNRYNNLLQQRIVK